jgi:glucose/arabinose dehydrogenase
LLSALLISFSLTLTACKSAPNSDAKPADAVEPSNDDNSNNNSDNDDSTGSENPDLKTYPKLAQIELPEGFQIRMYAPNIPGARSLQIAPGGTLFVGSRGQGKVYAVVDSDNDKRADEVKVIAEGLNSPNGVAFHDGDLYVAEISKIWRYPDIEANLDDPPEPELVSDAFPSEEHHGWKFIKFGPDGKLYVPVGAPCNICEPDTDKFANIQRMNPDGSELEVFARGIRNTVGFDWHPETGELWFTDNGRDMLGDTRPPDELNHAPEQGLHFGYPYCHGVDIQDPEFGQGVDCSQYVAPAQNLVAHAAALGMQFYDGEMFPEEYKNQIFIAEHGSWNRSEKVGYRVSLVRLDEQGNAVSYGPFATGWLQGQSAWGRPVDVEIMKDGSLLVSDDHAGAIYRIIYQP